MRFRFAIPLIFLAVLALLIPPSYSSFVPAVQVGPCPALGHGLAFLEARYNPALGLLNESPTTAPHIYWLTNDNVLAAFTLEQLSQPGLSAAVWASVRSYGSDSNGLVEVLWGKPVNFPPYIVATEIVTQVAGDTIQRETRPPGQPFTGWAGYADMNFWAALNAYQQGHPDEAQALFANGMALYDGTGFNDDAHKNDENVPHRYDTYKLALALYAGAAIQAPLPQADSLRASLHAMQRADGGFITHYLGLGQPIGDANTETTSLALLALRGKC